MKLRSILAVGVTAVGFIACEAEEPTPAAEPAKPAAAEAPKPEPKPTSHPDCVGPVTTGTAETVKVNGVTWELNGSTLTWKAPVKKNATLTLGVVTDIKENTEENVENLRAFLKWFKKNKVDAIVVAGDTGENQAQIEGALTVLAEAKVPVLDIIGNREGKAAHKAAHAAVRAKFPHVFDMNVVRRVDTPAADLVSMPGYFNRSFIHNEDGCAYYAEDVAAMSEIVKASDSPVILLSHGGPRQDGAEGIDRTSEGANVGDPELANAIDTLKIPFGIFGNIHEAGGRATNAKGTEVLKPGPFHPALYLNPGPADGVRWTMNDKTESVGMAAVMTVKDGKAKYSVMRVPDPEKKLAKGGKKAKSK